MIKDLENEQLESWVIRLPREKYNLEQILRKAGFEVRELDYSTKIRKIYDNGNYVGAIEDGRNVIVPSEDGRFPDFLKENSYSYTVRKESSS